MNVVYVTGNSGKAKYFSKIVGMDIEHNSADTEEIQSLDLKEVALFKAKQAYSQLKKPVIVEDTSLSIDALGGLPGPFIKWFEKSLGLDGICNLVGAGADRSAYASNVHVYFDGKQAKIFESGLQGSIATGPKGDTGFGFNPIFIPKGSAKTLAQMSEPEFIEYYLKIKPIMQVKDFLLSLDRD